MDDPSTYSIFTDNISKSKSLLSQILITLLCLTFLAWLGKYHWGRRRLYRLTSKFPGPRGYPIIGMAYTFLGGAAEVYKAQMNHFENYPDIGIIWYGNNPFCSIGTPEHLEIVLNSPNCLDKSILYTFLRKFVGSGLITAPAKIWKKNRRIINPTFTTKVINSFMDIFNNHNKIYTEILRKKSGQKDIDIFHLTSAYTLDILFESIMGVQVGTQGKGSQPSDWIETILKTSSQNVSTIYYHIDFIFNLTNLAKDLGIATVALRSFINGIIKKERQIFEEKMKKIRNGEVIEEDTNRKKSLMEYLFYQLYEEEAMTDDQLKDEVITFTMAGTDTTATTLGFCYIMMGMHPEIQRKLRDEVLDTLGADRDVTAEDLPQMKLLDRFIKETARLFPAAPLIYRSCIGDIDLGDYIIPAGCQICIGLIAIQRNEKYWKDPLKFDPDRFLPEEVAKRHPYSFVPFSGGPRNCIGNKYASILMKTTLANLIRKFDIETDYKSVKEIKLEAHLVLRPVDGWKLTFTVRE